jgi:hypothetical protein
MGQTEQEIIAKILSFSYEELSGWMKARLRGNDKYFSIHVGHETDLRGFLSDAYHHIDNDKFRDNFIKILNEMISEVERYSPAEIETDKEYIYELFTLCGNIKEFEDKNVLFEIARSGKFKGFHVHDSDIHLVLLTSLSSYRVGGNYNFWIDQMQDNSNKYYTNAAFYALLDNGYSLDILFKHIGTFIDRFNEGIELGLGIESLFDDHDPKEIFSRFKSIEPELNTEQQEAVNKALLEAGYDKIFESHQAEALKPVEFKFANLKERIFSLGIWGLNKEMAWGHQKI